MKKRLLLTLCLMALTKLVLATEPLKNSQSLRSPDGRMEALFELKDGIPYYSLYRNGKPVVLPSKMGFTLAQARKVLPPPVGTLKHTWGTRGSTFL